MRIPSGVVDQYIYFVAVDITDLKTRETGLSSFTVYRSRNGAAAAAMTTPTINETDTTNMPGVYELLLDEDMTLDAGDQSQEMVFHITQASMAPVTRTIELYRPSVTAGETIGVSSGAVSSVTTTATATAVTTVNGLAANVITTASINNDAITAAKIANGAIDAATFAADVDAEVLSYIVDDATRIDASALNTAAVTTIPAILVDTAEIGAAGAGLTAIDLPDQTMNITGNITGNVSGSVGSVTGITASDVGAIKAKTDSLTFTVAGKTDANITHVIANPVQVNGASDTNWGGTP